MTQPSIGNLVAPVAASANRDRPHYAAGAGVIPPSRPQLRKEDFAYIDDILLSKHVGQGVLVEELERATSEYLGVRYGVALSHGTQALHLSLLALGVGPGDEVIIPSYVGVSVLHAVNYAGAQPALVDIDPMTLNPDPQMIQKLITSRTKAVVLTHTFGFPTELEDICSLGIPVIEDCAHALGARYRGRPAGSWGRSAILSFNSTKMVGAGEGGVLCTDDPRLARRVRQLRKPDLMPKYEVRYNYKMSDLTAGLAISQFRRLEYFVQRRQALAARYGEALAGSRLRLQQAEDSSEPSYYRFVVLTRRPALLMREASERGIECDRPVFIPLHVYLDMRGLKEFKNTELVWRAGVSVPLYPDLSEQEVSRVLRFLEYVGGREAK